MSELIFTGMQVGGVQKRSHEYSFLWIMSYCKTSQDFAMLLSK